jgi:hypothetical protein
VLLELLYYLNHRGGGSCLIETSRPLVRKHFSD